MPSARVVRLISFHSNFFSLRFDSIAHENRYFVDMAIYLKIQGYQH